MSEPWPTNTHLLSDAEFNALMEQRNRDALILAPGLIVTSKWGDVWDSNGDDSVVLREGKQP